jgi:hypothetical protein
MSSIDISKRFSTEHPFYTFKPGGPGYFFGPKKRGAKK